MSEDELVRHVAAHKFWRVKVTPQMVGKFIDKLHDQQGTVVVWLDDRFFSEFFDRRDGESPAILEMYRKYGAGPSDRGFSGRMITIDMGVFSTRPSRVDLLRLFPEKLDSADYQAPKK